MDSHIEVEANLSTIPFGNLALLLGGIAVLLILVSVIFFYLIKRLGIKKLGNIQIEHYGQSELYRMNEEKDTADDICRRAMRAVTANIKLYINNVFSNIKICPMARITIASNIRFPLFESVSNNHFTTELMPDHFEAYRSRIIELIKDEYVSLSSFSKEIKCSHEQFPPWENVQTQLLECLDVWIKRIAREVYRTCEKKVMIYKKYYKQFFDAKDEYRARIAQKMYEKNERYIEVLKTRIK